MEPNSNGIVRFGVFEVDVEARELRKHGLRVKLQDQPFQVLALLLERPGEVVTREDLQQALWPADTFVEFDHGLNTAIQKIRAAIGDSPSNPRFIETIPRRGYRFIGPVDSGVPSAPEVRAEPSIKTIWTERGRLIAVLAAAAAAIALVAAVAFRSPSAASYPVPVLTQITFDTGLSFMPAISPDGKFVVFASDRSGEKNFDIWLRQVGVEKALRLTEHEADDLRPVFSPDGGTIAFSSTRDGGGLYTVPVLGGASRLVAPVRASRHAFSPDGRWLAYTTENRPWAELVLVPASGGEPQQLEAPPGRRHRTVRLVAGESHLIRKFFERLSRWLTPGWVNAVRGPRSRFGQRWPSRSSRPASLAPGKTGARFSVGGASNPVSLAFAFQRGNLASNWGPGTARRDDRRSRRSVLLVGRKVRFRRLGVE